MSILFKNEDVCIISHEKYIANIYRETSHLSKVVSFSLKRDLFNIVNPYLRDAQKQNQKFHEDVINSDYKKRKKNSVSFQNSTANETEIIKSKFLQLWENLSIKELYFNSGITASDFMSNNTEARSISKMHFDSVSKDTSVFNGRNENNSAITVVIGDKTYIIPAKSQFYNCDVLNFASKIPDDVKYDFILLDPPWWNKYIRRKRKRNIEDGYKMMYNEEIVTIPIQRLISNDGLVAIWCTNSKSHLNAIIHDIFPSWELRYVSSWFWLKVTKRGQPVCQFSEPPGKQPYERIVFGCPSQRNTFYKLPEDNQIIISVPSAIHSHKPPLTDLIAEYLVDSPKCLELFARYLLPAWTSCGNQVLSLQNEYLYQMSSDK